MMQTYFCYDCGPDPIHDAWLIRIHRDLGPQCRCTRVLGQTKNQASTGVQCVLGSGNVLSQEHQPLVHTLSRADLGVTWGSRQEVPREAVLNVTKLPRACY